jgi:hypothetical protein
VSENIQAKLSNTHKLEIHLIFLADWLLESLIQANAKCFENALKFLNEYVLQPGQVILKFCSLVCK